MITLAGCMSPPPEVTPIKLSQSGVTSLESSVRDVLRDPSSAQFGNHIAFNVKEADGTITTTACGYVNAKNGFGGYGGMTPYIALGTNGRFDDASVDLDVNAMILCKGRYGVSI